MTFPVTIAETRTVVELSKTKEQTIYIICGFLLFFLTFCIFNFILLCKKSFQGVILAKNELAVTNTHTISTNQKRDIICVLARISLLASLALLLFIVFLLLSCEKNL